MQELAGHAGDWVGTNKFRLTPKDQPYVDQATANISHAAGASLAVIRYTWSHPESGAHDGLLVIGRGDDPNTTVAFWGDSFHQTPAQALHGKVENGIVTLRYTYAGDWEWVIVVDPSDPAVLRMRMDNVIPESAAPEYPPGAYWAMQWEAHRDA